MKKLILISFLFIYNGIYSQYNLEFSRVINLPLSGSNQTVKVPDGKVWKIQQFQQNSSSTSAEPTTLKIISPDGASTAFKTDNFNGDNSKPIWVPSGYTVKSVITVWPDGRTVSINALEFSKVSTGNIELNYY
tara:strand:- start:254 stop:652 length:399 start_codon:yes stop_codon:yes gene_type:complete